jgi:hypothetical protein
MLMAVLGLAPLTCQAVPSFARQTGLQCIACHTSFPELTPFGRQFKLLGYTFSNGLSTTPPLAFMLQPSFTNTGQGQAGGAAPGFGPNNNIALTQASIFYAGRLFGPYAANLFGTDGATFANKFGIFSQTTYDPIADRLAWDNSELRYADTGTVGEHTIIYGAYVNNNPTMQDPWNTTPAWSFPYLQSGLAAQTPPSPLIDGPLAQQVGGAGTYMFLDNAFYFDVAAYHSLSPQFLNAVGINPDDVSDQISDLAPYWRLAYTTAVDNNSYELGTFGMAADTVPGGDPSSGKDHTLDVGFDAQAQFAFTQNDITVMASWIHEEQNLGASQAQGISTNSADNLDKFKFTVDYLYDKTYGASVQYFAIGGSHDTGLYQNSVTGSPASDGVILELDWLPFNKSGGPAFLPTSNLKLSVQYTMYDRINGASTNYDGAGHNASDNNTFYVQAWLAF